MTTFFILLLIIAAIPGYYLEYFLLFGLLDRLGYQRFILLLISYLVVLGITIHLMTEEIIGLGGFLFWHLSIQGVGLYYLRKELIEEINKLFKRSKSKE